VLLAIREARDLPPEVEARLRAAVEEFLARFRATLASAAVAEQAK